MAFIVCSMLFIAGTFFGFFAATLLIMAKDTRYER